MLWHPVLWFIVFQCACICQADCPNRSLRKGRTAYKQCKSCPPTSIPTGRVLEPNTQRREREREKECLEEEAYNTYMYIYMISIDMYIMWLRQNVLSPFVWFHMVLLSNKTACLKAMKTFRTVGTTKDASLHSPQISRQISQGRTQLCNGCPVSGWAPREPGFDHKLSRMMQNVYV